jgi:hypothetical protein
MQPSLATSHLYFFDFPIADALAISNSALRFLFYGSPHGAFGQQGDAAIPETRFLENYDGFKVSLEHLSNDPLDNNYEYNLVFLTKNTAKDLWIGSKRANNPELKKLTRRVHLGVRPSLQAKRYKTPFWVRFKKPIYLSIFDANIGDDNYVPSAFRQQFHNKFTGFLMRSEKGFPLVRTMFDAYGLKMVNRQEVQDRLDGNLQVVAYQTGR